MKLSKLIAALEIIKRNVNEWEAQEIDNCETIILDNDCLSLRGLKNPLHQNFCDNDYPLAFNFDTRIEYLEKHIIEVIEKRRKDIQSKAKERIQQTAKYL